MSFDKTFKKITGEIKVRCNTMLANGYGFCNMVLDPSMPFEDSNIYPETNELVEYIQQLFTGELAMKPLPLKALEEMKRKGVTPKPGPLEMLLILIVPSTTDIVLTVWDPKSEVPDIINCAIPTGHGHISRVGNSFIYPHAEPFKACDDVMRNCFNYLRTKGIYKESDDE